MSTDDVPEAHRFAAWAAAVHSTLGLEAQPLPAAPGPFRAHLSGRSSGPLQYLRVAADAHRVARRKHGVAQPWDGYRIYREAGAGAWFKLPDLEGVTRAGDLIIYDTNLPMETHPSADYQLELWSMPRGLLDPHLPALGRPLARLLSRHGGVDALAGSYLDSLTRNWDSIAATDMAVVADTLARLVGIACGGAAAEQADAVREGRLAAARRHIDRHLADPELSPGRAAAALGISVRALHLLFEPTGTSFAREVLRRRLEACRGALLAEPARQVTDIAFAWGFSNLSSFYRAFQAAFGLSPGELRATLRGTHRF